MQKTLHFVHPAVRVIKRLEDIVLALLGLLVLIPLTPFIAWGIKRASPGPVFIVQPRVGCSYQTYTVIFDMIKFRTMHTDAHKIKNKSVSDEINLQVRTLSDDKRIFPFAKFLRKTRLDELPQVINVLKGEMSFVGPRPDLLPVLSQMQGEISHYEDRTTSLRPGITGLAQVKKGYVLSIDDTRERSDYDAIYAMLMAHPWRWFKCEVGILWHTLSVVFLRRGQ